jgi:hypothetical protein
MDSRGGEAAEANLSVPDHQSRVEGLSQVVWTMTHSMVMDQ